MAVEERRICHRCGHVAAAPVEWICPVDGLFLIAESDHLRARWDTFLGRILGGKYPLLAKIGAGGMGAVYRSVQHPLDRPVAIKVILTEGAFERLEARERFLREAKAVANISHPAVVTLHDFGVEEDGTSYMVMELLRGRTLSQRLAEGGMTVRELVDAGRVVLDALHVAHQQGIVHRDLKPANIMLCNDTTGSGLIPKVKVLDFGLAKMVSSSTDASQKSTLTGTPTYVSPEQVRGIPVDGRSDLYSLATILYEALAGHPPFATTDVAQIVAVRLFADPPSLPAVPWIPPLLAQTVLRGLARQREDRYAQAAEMRAALEAVDLQQIGDLALPLPSGAVAAQQARFDEAAAAALVGEAADSRTPTPPGSGNLPDLVENIGEQTGAEAGTLPGGPAPRGLAHARLDRRVLLLAGALLLLLLVGGTIVLVARLGGAPPTPVGLPPLPTSSPYATPHPPPDATPEAPPPAAPRPAATRVHLDSDPGGATVVDAATGRELGRTPLDLEAPVRPGARGSWLVRARDRAPITVSVPLDGEEHTERARLKPAARPSTDAPEVFLR